MLDLRELFGDPEEQRLRQQHAALSTLQPSPMVPEVGTRMPTDRDSLGFWERVGASSDGQPFGHVPVHEGKGNGGLAMGLLALAAGFANARAKRGLKDYENRIDFNDAEQKRADLRNAQNAKREDAMLVRTQDTADEVRKAAAARDAAVRNDRVKRLSDAVDRKRSRLQSLADAARAAGLSPQELALIKAEYKRLSDEVKGNESALAKLGIEVDAYGEPLLPDSPIPAKPEKDDGGKLITVKTPEGPRLMPEREAMAKGLVPINARDKRAASPTERAEFAKSIGVFSQIKAVADNYKKSFVGPARGRLGALGQKTGDTSGMESVFRSNLAALRNRLIKRDAGSAVTASEAERLLQELPTENDPSGVFEAKFQAFQNALLEVARANVQTMEASDIDTSDYPALPESTYTLGRKPAEEFDPEAAGGVKLVPVRAHDRKAGKRK